MTITIEASADVEETITPGAAREGVTPEEYALRAISYYAKATNGVTPASHGDVAVPALPSGVASRHDI